MHDGALATLEDVIEFYDRGGGDEASIPAENIDPELVPLGLSAEEKQDLLAFMHALTDSTIAVKVPARVPSGLTPPGLELAAEAGLVVPVPAPVGSTCGRASIQLSQSLQRLNLNLSGTASGR